MTKTIQKVMVETIKNNDIDRRLKLKKLDYMAKIAGKNINSLYYGVSPLIYAMRANDEEVVKLLKSYGAKEVVIDLEESNQLADTIFDVYKLSRFGTHLPDTYKQDISNLMEKGANLNRVVHDGEPLINIAIISCDVDTVKLMLENGVEINLCNDQGVTPLMKAVESGNKDMVKLFLENNTVDVDAVDEDNNTALYRAIKNQYVEIAEMLIDKGADVNMVCEGDYTPLDWAIFKKKDEMIKMLISKGIKTNKRGENLTSFMSKPFSSDFGYSR